MSQDLVTRARQGDREAFGALARMHGDSLFALAHRILRDADRADDALQTTLISAWRELPRLREPERFEAWLHRILVRSCYTETRRLGRLSARVAPLAGDPPAQEMQTGIEDRDLLERGFRRLSPEHRAILAMHHYLGMSTADIADELHVPLGTVRSRLHYAHRAMRAALDAVERSVVAGDLA